MKNNRTTFIVLGLAILLLVSVKWLRSNRNNIASKGPLTIVFSSGDTLQHLFNYQLINWSELEKYSLETNHRDTAWLIRFNQAADLDQKMPKVLMSKELFFVNDSDEILGSSLIVGEQNLNEIMPSECVRILILPNQFSHLSKNFSNAKLNY